MTREPNMYPDPTEYPGIIAAIVILRSKGVRFGLRAVRVPVERWAALFMAADEDLCVTMFQLGESESIMVEGIGESIIEPNASRAASLAGRRHLKLEGARAYGASAPGMKNKIPIGRKEARHGQNIRLLAGSDNGPRRHLGGDNP